jgi:hypothetical protein
MKRLTRLALYGAVLFGLYQVALLFSVNRQRKPIRHAYDLSKRLFDHSEPINVVLTGDSSKYSIGLLQAATR